MVVKVIAEVGVLNDMANLLSTARRTFRVSKIINSILYRVDISDVALISLNDQYHLMSWNFCKDFALHF